MSQHTFEENMKFATRWETRAAEFVMRSQLAPASEVFDRHFGTDMFVLSEMAGSSIALRHRRAGAADADPGLITIRSYANGARTELAKILDGEGKYMFQACVDYDGQDISWWRLFSLDVFRKVMKEHSGTWHLHNGGGSNRDGTAWLTYNTHHKSFVAEPGWMIDASDDYPFETKYDKRRRNATTAPFCKA